MKKSSLPFIAIICLIGGLLIESEFHIFGDRSDEEEASTTVEIAEWSDEFSEVAIESPIDGAMQKAYFYKTKAAEAQPLIVSLHTWSHTYTQFDTINELALAKDYNFIHPDFRGRHDNKDACCGELNISDIDASIDYALANANVDPEKIYVMGMSGGGYATLAMFMKSKHKIKKFSSWVPLVDLVQWYDETKIRKLKYSAEILTSTESLDGVLNEEIAKEKSPIYWETPVEKLDYARLDIYAGIYDGMLGNGVIPITHSIDFYNKLLTDTNESDKSKYVSDAEKLALLEFRKPLADYGSIGGRKVSLIKESNNISLTLFEGGHEMLTEFAFSELVK